MKVRCKATKLSQVHPNGAEMAALDLNSLPADHTEDEYMYGLGREFTVYGIEFRNNVPFYFVCEEVDDSYPVPLFYGCFDVIDDRFSSTWKIVNDRGDGDESNILMILPRVWADSPMFYEELLEENEKEMGLFRELRCQLESEFDSAD